MFGTIGYVLFYSLLAALLIDAVYSYRKGTGSIWQKLLSVGKSSASILTARVGMIGGMGLQALVELADVVAAPGVKAFIDQYVNAKAVGYTMITFAVISEYARRRRLSAPLVGTTPASEK